VQVASGKGTRNLYSDSEVFKLAIANKLRDGGVGFRAIRYVVENVDPEEFVYGSADWLILRVTRRKIAFRAAATADIESELVRIEVSDTEAVSCFAKLSNLLGEAKARIDNYVEEHEVEDGHD
jgi:hypothetical protein